jgi:dienelactone hydrolase
MTFAETPLVEGPMPLRGVLCAPAEPSGASVIVLGGSEGGGQVPHLLARSFAQAGVVALGLAYFGVDGCPDALSSIPLEYFAIAADWLAAQPGVEPDGVTVLGMSRGSEAAMLTALHFPKLIRGVVATVPGNVVLAGWPDPGPAWTLDGAPLPYTDTFGPECEDPDAIIPVERIEGPLLLVTAGKDQVWQSAAMADAIRRRLAAHRHPFEVQVLSFADATHALGYVAPLEVVRPRHPPGIPDVEARVAAWPEVVRFVREVPAALVTPGL